MRKLQDGLCQICQVMYAVRLPANRKVQGPTKAACTCLTQTALGVLRGGHCSLYYVVVVAVEPGRGHLLVVAAIGGRG